MPFSRADRKSWVPNSFSVTAWKKKNKGGGKNRVIKIARGVGGGRSLRACACACACAWWAGEAGEER